LAAYWKKWILDDLTAWEIENDKFFFMEI